MQVDKKIHATWARRGVDGDAVRGFRMDTFDLATVQRAARSALPRDAVTGTRRAYDTVNGYASRNERTTTS